jgi:hypothetical protein
MSTVFCFWVSRSCSSLHRSVLPPLFSPPLGNGVRWHVPLLEIEDAQVG